MWWFCTQNNPGWFYVLVDSVQYRKRCNADVHCNVFQLLSVLVEIALCYLCTSLLETGSFSFKHPSTHSSTLCLTLPNPGLVNSFFPPFFSLNSAILILDTNIYNSLDIIVHFLPYRAASHLWALTELCPVPSACLSSSSHSCHAQSSAP